MKLDEPSGYDPDASWNEYYVVYPVATGLIREKENVDYYVHEHYHDESVPYTFERSESEARSRSGTISVSGGAGYKGVIEGTVGGEYSYEREVSLTDSRTIGPITVDSGEELWFWQVTDYDFEHGVVAEYDTWWDGENQFRGFEEYYISEADKTRISYDKASFDRWEGHSGSDAYDGIFLRSYQGNEEYVRDGGVSGIPDYYLMPDTDRVISDIGLENIIGK